LQEDCARILLFRGADRSIKNYANQTAAELAIIADNVHISELINNFKTADVGKPVSTLLLCFSSHNIVLMTPFNKFESLDVPFIM